MNLPNFKTLSINGISLVDLSINGVLAWDSKSLPSIYQEVEWIAAAADVDAYIDLRFAFDTKALIQVSQYVTEKTTTYLFGATDTSGNIRCMITAPFYHATNQPACAYGSTGAKYIELSGATYILNGWSYYELSMMAGKMIMSNKANGATASRTDQAAYTMTDNLYLFGQNYKGSLRYGGIRKISYFKYYDKNDELICDLVPCYRKSDGVIGMYDLVRRIFLTNVGSGAFTKGADV